MNPSARPGPGCPDPAGPYPEPSSWAAHRHFALIGLLLVAFSTFAAAIAAGAADPVAAAPAAAVSASPAVASLPGATNLVYPPAPEIPAPGFGAALFRVLLALGLVLGLLGGGSWLVRRLPHLAAGRGVPSRLKVLEVRSLGGKHALFVVAYDKQRLLVGSSPGGLNLIDRLPPDESPAASEELPRPAVAQSFREALGQLLNQPSR